MTTTMNENRVYFIVPIGRRHMAFTFSQEVLMRKFLKDHNINFKTTFNRADVNKVRRLMKVRNTKFYHYKLDGLNGYLTEDFEDLFKHYHIPYTKEAIKK